MTNKRITDFLLSNSIRNKFEQIVRSITLKDVQVIINETGSVYTTGTTIVLNPFIVEESQLQEIIPELQEIFEITDLSLNKAYLIIAFGELFHEMFHILWSDFEILKSIRDPLLHNILNVIEDSFVELYGTNKFYESKFYIHLTNYVFGKILKFNTQPDTPQKIIEYMMRYILCYQNISRFSSFREKEVFEKIIPLLEEGRKSKQFKKRYECAKKIYEIIRKYYPQQQTKNTDDIVFKDNHDRSSGKGLDFDNNNSIDNNDDMQNNINTQNSTDKENQNNKHTTKQETKSKDNNKHNNIDDDTQNGSDRENQDNSERDNKHRSGQGTIKDRNSAKNISKEMKNKALKEIETIEKEYQSEEKIKSDLNDIKSKIESRLPIKVIYNTAFTFSNRDFYQYSVNQHKTIINKFNKELKNLLEKQKSEQIENKQIIGTRINSRLLYDKKQRIFEKRIIGKGYEPLNIIVLVDSSGSMNYMFYEVKQTVITMFETFNSLSDLHVSIIFHNATDTCNIMVFNEKNKYNICKVEAEGGTREDLVLQFVKNYLPKLPYRKTLIFIVSDGEPQHNMSIPQKVMFQKVKELTQQLIKLDCYVLAIALYEHIYESLKKLYNNTVVCSQIEKLPRIIIKNVEQFLK